MSYALALANPGSDIDKYLAQVYTIPVLSREEELELTQEFFKTEDVKLAHKLVISHLRFVVHIAKSYAGYGLPLADIIQEGNVGLLKAVKKFDPDKGVRLVSFAVHWIRAEIHEFILKNWRIVKIATTKAQRKLFFNLRSKKQSTGWLTDAEAKKIAEDLDVSVKEVMHMENRLNSTDSAFDLGVDDEDDERAFSPSQYLEDHSFSPEQIVEQENYEQINHGALLKGVANLDRRSQEIVRSRWLDDEKLTLNELADKFDVSAERIRQIEATAFKKLKASLCNV
ncbi:MAG: RNA polymerase sigma factor RpoH [Proteobacteria bacterium]|nr:RNA polymerase sigma factor RpoH [SAR86 cluster bacterium]MDA0344551.1 RNA polymerase sigma factor RpoH [Pseudomonadota bacterium]MDA0899952.1 RNA polymerase sigma factor RpoH [Pseudomonadota bacterium]MDA1056293.1 RNA polymerase sigma factor RpoH [Pseudomonadota bacterium]